MQPTKPRTLTAERNSWCYPDLDNPNITIPTMDTSDNTKNDTKPYLQFVDGAIRKDKT